MVDALDYKENIILSKKIKRIHLSVVMFVDSNPKPLSKNVNL